MPILDVQLVGPVADDIRPGLAQRIAEATGRALDSRPQGTWASCAFLTNRTMLKTATDLETRSLCWSPSCKRNFLRGVNSPSWHQDVATIAEACSRPVEDVHILLEPPAAGRIAFRRKVVTSTGTHSSTRASAFQALQRYKGDRAGYARQYGEERNERGRRAGERIAEF